MLSVYELTARNYLLCDYFIIWRNSGRELNIFFKNRHWIFIPDNFNIFGKKIFWKPEILKLFTTYSNNIDLIN